MKFSLLLLDDTGTFSFPYKQVVAEFALGKLGVENLLVLLPEAGLADRLTLSLALDSGVELTSTTEFLGGGFYSQELRLSRSQGGLELRGDVTFRAGFMLGGRVLLRLRF